MATKTKKRPAKKASKKSGPPRRRPVAQKPSTNGKAKSKSAGTAKFDPKQKPLDSMEDVDEKIPELDDECQRYLAACDTHEGASEDMKSSLDKIGDLIKKHELDLYKHSGRRFFWEPGSPQVKCKKLNQGGG